MITKINDFIWEIWYFVLYQFYFRFSGAHNKPKFDSKFDPTLEHQNNYFYKKIRKLENQYWSKHIISHSPFTKYMQLPVLTNDQINIQIFNEITKNKTYPVVIKGMLKNTNAVKKWNKNYFYKYQNAKIFALTNPSKINAYTSFTQKLNAESISLKDFLDVVNMDDKPPMYINNVTSIFMEYPELIKDLNINTIKKIGSNVTDSSWLKINLFMGGKGTGSSLHCAGAGNYFFNIHGNKKWILIDPKYSKFLKSTPAKDVSFVISGRDVEDNNDEVLHHLPKYEIVLEPGDVLYNPPWWWHYVKNESDFTIGCAIRDHYTYWQSFYNNYMYMLMSTLTYRMNPVLLKIAELYYGREKIVNQSMKSDKDIVSHLSSSS